MELLYLWVNDNGKSLKEIGIPFSTKFNIEVIILDRDEDSKQPTSLKLVNNCNKEIGLRNFYGKNIESLNLILGENGAGKSSVINELLNVFFGKSSSIMSSILVTDKYVVCRSTFLKVDISEFYLNGKELKLIKNAEIVNAGLPKIKHKTEEEALNLYGYSLIGNLIKDITVINLSSQLELDSLFHDGYSLYGNSKNREIDYYYYLDYTIANMIVSSRDHYSSEVEKIDLPDSIITYKKKEKEDLMSYVSNVEDMKLTFDPERFVMYETQILFDDIHEYFFEKIFEDNFKEIADKPTSIIRGLKQYEGSKENKFYYHLKKSVLYSSLRSAYNEWLRSKNKEDVNNMLLDDFFTHFPRLDEDPFHKYFKNSKFLNKYFNDPNTIVSEISKLLVKYESQIELMSDGINVNIGNEKFWKDFFMLTDYSNIKKFTKKKIYYYFPLIPSIPNISAGERIALRDYKYLKQAADLISSNKQSKNNNIILLLDELDLGLHPEWQRLFLSRLLKAIERFFENNKCNIILTSHSPIVSSDVRSDDIIYLKRKNGKSELKKLGHLTFGANIHSLFTDSFFLKGGLMGEFAKEKISVVLTEIENMSEEENKEKNTKKKIDELKSFANLIGEPLIRNKILERIDSIHVPNEALLQEKEELLKKLEDIDNKLGKL